jgi:hypothetical protein
VMMAGGSLAANWTSGDIRAWFAAQTDFLIRFKPFHYRIDVQVSIGASFTINLWFTTKAITIQAGANLHIEGPPFGGTAQVHVSIISFSISFGPRSADPQPVGWGEFRKSFLPPANDGERKTGGAPAPAARAPAPASNAATLTDSLVTLSAPTGLTGTMGTGAGAPWVVHGAALSVAVGAQIPLTDATVVTTAGAAPKGAWNRDLGVGPMGAAPGQLASTLTVTIKRGDAPDDGDWNATAINGNVPAGLWRNTSNQLGGLATVDKALTGLTLTPAAKEPANPPRSVPVAALLSNERPTYPALWSDTAADHSDSFDQEQAEEVVEAALVESEDFRAAILRALDTQEVTTAQSVDVGHFADHAADLLSSPPRLRLLGETIA